MPAAPPRETGSPPSATRSSRSAASSTSCRQPAALSPKVVGTACRARVRPAIRVSRCVGGEPASGVGRPPAGPRTISRSARAATSIAPVSRMSWLVEPRCTYSAAAGSSARRPRAVAPRPGPTTGLAVSRAASASARDVEPVGAGGGGDGGGRRRAGTVPQPGLGAGQRGLGVQHRLQPGRRRRPPPRRGCRPGPGESSPVSAYGVGRSRRSRAGVTGHAGPARGSRVPAAAARGRRRQREHGARRWRRSPPASPSRRPGRMPAAVTQCTASVGTP